MSCTSVEPVTGSEHQDDEHSNELFEDFGDKLPIAAYQASPLLRNQLKKLESEQTGALCALLELLTVRQHSRTLVDN